MSSIKDLQVQLYPLLGNIFVEGIRNESIGKFNISDTTDENIYKIPENQPNLDIDKYRQFLEFMIRELTKNNDEFLKNTGEILTAHYVEGITKEDKNEIDKIKERYRDLYLLSLKKKTNQSTQNQKIDVVFRLKNKKNQEYPLWLIDLKDKSKSVLYKEIETKLGIKTILQQNNDEFLNTIKKRMDSLLDSHKKESNEERKEFYRLEYEKYDKYSKHKDIQELDIKTQIEDLCNNTIWGISDYNFNKQKFAEIEQNFISFKNFIETTPNELNYIKTFIPKEYFNDSDGSPIWDKIRDLMITKNRNFRQYIFGYTEDIEKYAKYKTFFELLNMDYNDNTQNLLVLWNMVSNLYFNRCAISNNKIPFSIRFIIPTKEFNLVDKTKNTFTIKKTVPINPFIKITFYNSKLHFIGFINLKFYHEQSNQFRNWILLLFKNDLRDDESLLDYFSGNIPKIIILDYNYNYINNGALLFRNSVTYEELADFIEYEKQSKVKIYQSLLEPQNVLFISPNRHTSTNLNLLGLESLLLKQVKLYKNSNFSFKIEYNNSMTNNMSGGNKINTETIKTKISNNIINLYNDSLTSTKSYSEYFKYCNLINKYDDAKVYECYKVLYNYILISSDEIQYSFLKNIEFQKNLHIPKYIPLSNKFYSLYEIFIKYKILNKYNKNDKILNIGYNMTALEILYKNNYKIKNINCIIPSNSENYYKYISNEWKKQLSIISGIYDININFYKNSLYNLINEDLNKNNLVVYTIYTMDDVLYNYENFVNTNNIFLGMLIGLKYTEINGDFILHFGSVAYKHIADIYYILKNYFKLSELYYPEISNKSKKTGVFGIFQGFKGINHNDLNYLLDIFKKIKNINLLESLQNNKNEKIKYISSFLNNQDYKEVIDFNNIIYIKKLLFVQKVLNLLVNNTYKNIKLPTPDQILSSILYCRKYDIPIFDKYTITKQDNIITKTILSDMYGLHEPILYKFKGSFLEKSRTKSSFLEKSRTKNLSKKNSFFNNLFSNTSLKKTKKSNNSSHKLTHKQSTHKSLLKYKHNVSLEEAVFNSNNQLIQVGRLMDVRKDFSKVNPNELYYMLKEQFRYYKATNPRKVPNLDTKVQNLLGDFSISQAWLKMYEILSECNIIPTNRKGVYKSFHICEAPGTFINCINNFIHSKTQYDSYEWKAQSLKPSGKRGDKTISDQFGLIKRHPERWDWGVDNTGDITNTENIKYYAKIAKSMNINLMTSDCGLPMGDPKFFHVEFASYVSILYSLPLNGTLLYKILSPIDIPLLWNLIYITYKNFKEMYFFKPVQNSQSREFYIIGKGYLGTDQKVLDKLLNLVDKFDKLNFNKEEYDLYNDMYPEEFVIQVQTICERLASNYVNSIERIIYYVDNVDSLGKDYKKHIESYVSEKNEDWIRKYKPRRIDNKWVL